MVFLYPKNHAIHQIITPHITKRIAISVGIICLYVTTKIIQINVFYLIIGNLD